MLFDICKQRSLDKVMLTVFKGAVYRNHPVPRKVLTDPPKLTRSRSYFTRAWGAFLVYRLCPKLLLRMRSLSFVLDPSSPGYGASLPVDDGSDDWEDEGGGECVDEECDYMILSRSVASGAH